MGRAGGERGRLRAWAVRRSRDGQICPSLRPGRPGWRGRKGPEVCVRRMRLGLGGAAGCWDPEWHPGATLVEGSTTATREACLEEACGIIYFYLLNKFLKNILT